jgi:Cu+-exporting ATPase
VLRLAAALQQSSSHPLAHAVMDQVRGGAPPGARGARCAQALPGRGVRGGGRGPAAAAGQHAADARSWARSPGAAAEGAAAGAARVAAVSWLLAPGEGGGGARVLGLLAFGDTVKPASRPRWRGCIALGIRTVMLTGDNRGSARPSRKELGIDEVRAEVLPGDKAGHRQHCATPAKWSRWSATA